MRGMMKRERGERAKGLACLLSWVLLFLLVLLLLLLLPLLLLPRIHICGCNFAVLDIDHIIVPRGDGGGIGQRGDSLRGCVVAQNMSFLVVVIDSCVAQNMSFAVVIDSCRVDHGGRRIRRSVRLAILELVLLGSGAVCCCSFLLYLLLLLLGLLLLLLLRARLEQLSLNSEGCWMAVQICLFRWTSEHDDRGLVAVLACRSRLAPTASSAHGGFLPGPKM
mmetsp:Transcript_80318/g.167273  ORF Transcript_80318/g.167273 Transcript_80318/m.167273 type:complete len:221 (-) Transcript_80318:359-1021(-)